MKCLIISGNCEGVVCQNGATCYENKKNYYCQCRNHFYGHNCEKCNMAFEYRFLHKATGVQKPPSSLFDKAGSQIHTECLKKFWDKIFYFLMENERMERL